ncbi:MAG: hypothetical protein CSB13_10175 [Chloroflexi bacterium]|nr:MAG: hypothetical protein CSB13_10175 [Chloroflexota bacterium]
MSNLRLVVYNSVMESANQMLDPPNYELALLSALRVARTADAAAITRLLNSTRFAHYHVDWRLPVDWLGDPGFLVVPQDAEMKAERRMPGLLWARDEILACLVVTQDPAPAAWVRLAAVSAQLDLCVVLGEMFAVMTEYLRETAVTEVGWLVMDPWPIKVLPDLGFLEFSAIETYIKKDLERPLIKPVPDLRIRPVAVDDFERLAAMETAVFEPLWRFSQETLRLARRDAVSFDVALLDDLLVGYQISSGGRLGAHLVRLTIAPHMQGRGIGTAIFAHAIEGYQKRGYQHITLNTQIDNDASHHLYKKFGFSPSGEKFPLWVMPM